MENLSFGDMVLHLIHLNGRCSSLRRYGTLYGYRTSMIQVSYRILMYTVYGGGVHRGYHNTVVLSYCTSHCTVYLVIKTEVAAAAVFEI